MPSRDHSPHKRHKQPSRENDCASWLVSLSHQPACDGFMSRTAMVAEMDMHWPNRMDVHSWRLISHLPLPKPNHQEKEGNAEQMIWRPISNGPTNHLMASSLHWISSPPKEAVIHLDLNQHISEVWFAFPACRALASQFLICWYRIPYDITSD